MVCIQAILASFSKGCKPLTHNQVGGLIEEHFYFKVLTAAPINPILEFESTAVHWSKVKVGNMKKDNQVL